MQSGTPDTRPRMAGLIDQTLHTSRTEDGCWHGNGHVVKNQLLCNQMTVQSMSMQPNPMITPRDG
eukprot:1161105-Pelagomonas_calceolata.AAC.3